MFHQFAPTGLPQSNTTRTTRSQQTPIEQAIQVAVDGILSTNSSLNRKIAYNSAHPDTLVLIKSLDTFFSHGLLKAEKCYWEFVREFITNTERSELKTRWHSTDKRTLSLAWLKESLNKSNLQFQLFGFIASSDMSKQVHYGKNACIRNTALLKRVCLLIERLSVLEFHIEPPYQFKCEDTPIALPITRIDGTMSPIESSNSSLITGMPQHAIPLNIRVRRPPSQAIAPVGSYGEMTRNSPYLLEGLIVDLPEVDLSQLGTSTEHIVRTDKEQNFILDQMLRNQRFATKRNSCQFFGDDEEDEEETDERKKSNSLSSFVPEDPAEAGMISRVRSDAEEAKMLEEFFIDTLSQGAKQRDDSKDAHNKETTAIDSLLQAVASNPSLDNSVAMTKIGGDSSTTREDDEVSTLDEAEEALMCGEIFLDSHDQIKLQLDVFAVSCERFLRLFQVFTGHSAGQPVVRYLLLTNEFIYLLGAVNSANERSRNGGEAVNTTLDYGSVSPASAVLEEWSAETIEGDLREVPINLPKKFEKLVLLSICDLDHLTLDADYQAVVFQTRRRKFCVSSKSGFEQRQLLVETGSRILGKAIALAVRKALDITHKSTWEEENEKIQMKHRPFFISASQQSQLSLMLIRFLRKELGIQQPEVVHKALIYWHQCDIPRKQQKRRNSEVASGAELECYLYVREIHQRSWSSPRRMEWKQSYCVLSGHKLFQFADSSFKFAQRSLNLRDDVEQVYQIDLKNDEQYAFQLDFDLKSGITMDDGALLAGLQFSCPNWELMQKWVGALSMALSISSEQPPPVACALVLTETHVLFAQEGVNFLVDGFMRSLGSFHLHEIAEIFAIHTEFNKALVFRRNNGFDEWMLFREGTELDRMVARLKSKWQFPIQDCSAEESLSNTSLNQLFIQCVKMQDPWRTVPLNTMEE